MQLKGTYQEIWQISYPIILGSLAHSINQLIDTAFLGHSSKVALESITLAGIYYFVFVFIAGGLARGCQVILARYSGEKRDDKIGVAFDHLILIALILSVFLMLFFKYATPYVLAFVVKSVAIQESAMAYINMMNYAVIPVVLGFCFNGFYTGIGKTKVITLATVFMAITNIICGYIFIFGNFGFPPMGIKGAGIATAIADTVLFLVYLCYFLYRKHHKKFNAFTFKQIYFKQFYTIIRLSTPIILQNLIGIGSWWYFFLSIEKIGEHELAISGILKSLFVFIGIPVWSLASTSNTLISNIIGQGRIDDVVPALKKVLTFSVGISLSINLIIVLFPHQILSIFTNDTQLIQDTIAPFYTLMIALLFFSSGMIMNLGITGTGATFIPTIVEIFCCLFYVLYCYYFVQIKQSPLYICWGCEVVYWLTLLVFTTTYWSTGIWRKYIKNIDSISK
ncbi:MAG TPA: MATE family efflux transporter [Chitinophagales bacterium]|nr:MATE family efflux transporter [Chitinophagales bacterium]